MEKVGLLGIAAGAGMLLLGVGQEILDLSGHSDEKTTVIRQGGMPEAVRLDHGSHREAEGQSLQLTRATQVSTPSAMLFLGSPESPTR